MIGPEFQRHFVALFLVDAIYENRKEIRVLSRFVIDGFGRNHPAPEEFGGRLMAALETQTALVLLKPGSKTLRAQV